MPTPPASSETVTYGWSANGATKLYHKVTRLHEWGRRRPACNSGIWMDQTTAERHSVPAHLKPCPRCFGKAVQ